MDVQQCEVCQRVPSDRIGFYCHRCARNTLYEPRLKLAQRLLERELLGREIEEAADDKGSALTPTRNSNDARRSLSHNSARSEYRIIAARTQIILDDSRYLQAEIEKMRSQFAETRASIVRRRRHIKAAAQEIRYEEETTVRSMQENIAAQKVSWSRLHKRIMNGRHVLPQELVSLYGLQIRRRSKASGSRDTYHIVEVPVFNLKELNSKSSIFNKSLVADSAIDASPEHLNTSTYHVAHLIHLSAHYLGLRLPAEISLATAGQPHTYIHPPMSSYKAPALSIGLRELSSNKMTPRKRVLWIEKPLAQLASEDNQAYSLYLDAIVLLAWNVAWVAKTQGIDVGGKGWEDICAVGKNMWDLFAGDVHETKDDQPMARPIPSLVQQETDLPLQPIGSSQASAHSFLNSAGPGGAADHMKAWRYSIPTRIIETIKSALMNERMGADWEVLEKPEDEAAAQENNGQVAVLSSNADSPAIMIKNDGANLQ